MCTENTLCILPVAATADKATQCILEGLDVVAGRAGQEVEGEGDGGTRLYSSFMLPAWEPDQSISRTQCNFKWMEDL